MIEWAWDKDDRAPQPDTYTTRWDVNKGRLTAFLGGWTDWVNNGHHETELLHWRTAGAVYASACGDREAASKVPVSVRCGLYHIALTEYVKSRRCEHWTNDQRREAVELSWAETERRLGRKTE